MIFFLSEEQAVQAVKLGIPVGYVTKQEVHHGSSAGLHTFYILSEQNYSTLSNDESIKTTRLAFNLWNGSVYDSDPPETYINKNGEEVYVPSKYYAPNNIFNCTYAPYYFEAIKMRFEISM